uniref:Uncharacterized protein n=1 Tax=Ciona savignyi TaxID=51511 RepID=H2ZIG4_CIOSA
PAVLPESPSAWYCSKILNNLWLTRSGSGLPLYSTWPSLYLLWCGTSCIQTFRLRLFESSPMQSSYIASLKPANICCLCKYYCVNPCFYFILQIFLYTNRMSTIQY